MRAFAITALTLALSLSAHAEAPMETNHADVLGKTVCNWDSNYARLSGDGDSADQYGTSLGCGLFEGTELRAGVQRLSFDGGSIQALQLDGKTAIITRKGDGFGLSLAYAAVWAKASGDSLRYNNTSITLIGTQSFDAFTVHGNVGLVKPRGEDSFGTWALGGEYAVNPQIDLLAEVYGAEGSKPVYGLGARFKATKDWSFGLMGSQTRDKPEINTWSLTAKLAF